MRHAMINDLADSGKVTNSEVKQTFLPFNLFDENGNFTIPVIESKQGNRLYDISHRISEKIAETVPGLVDFPELIEEFQFQNNAQALIITYHEIMWDLMNKFEQDVVEKPIAFSNPENAGNKDVADLVFIVR